MCGVAGQCWVNPPYLDGLPAVHPRHLAPTQQHKLPVSHSLNPQLRGYMYCIYYFLSTNMFESGSYYIVWQSESLVNICCT